MVWDRRMDRGWTDRWKKSHIEVGAPPKKIKKNNTENLYAIRTTGGQRLYNEKDIKEHTEKHYIKLYGKETSSYHLSRFVEEIKFYRKTKNMKVKK